MDTRGSVSRIYMYKEDHHTLLRTKYESSGPCGFEDVLWFSHCKSMGTNDPRGGAILIPGAWLAGFIKRTTIHCYIQNMKALCLVVSEKKTRLYFPMTPPGTGPVWTPGARLAGFIKRTTIHCYTQNTKALPCDFGEKKIFFIFLSHCKSMGANDPRGGAMFDARGMVGRIYKEDHYTLLHTQYESSGPCGFGEDDFICFSHCKSMGANDPRGSAIFDPRGMIGSIYKEDHYTLLHTQYESSGPFVFGEDFLCFCHDAPVTGPVWTPAARLAGFIKKTTIHCYTKNMLALSLVVSEKKIFLCFSHCKSKGAIWETRVLIRLGPNLLQPFPLLNNTSYKI